MRRLTKRIDKELYKKIAMVALPIVLQNLLDAAVNSADVLMLNFVGQTALSASSLAGQFGNVCFMFLFGIGTGVSMLSAQYWGKKDTKAIEKVEGLGLRFSMLVAVIAALLCLLVPQLLMRIFTNDAELIRLGSVYLRFYAPCLLFWSISAVYTSILRCIGRVFTSTAIEIITLACNVTLNAVFIFGLLGAPKLGVAGVALATSISRAVQLLCCIVVSAKNEDVKLTLKPVFEHHPALLKDFLSMALPAIANDVVWGLAFSMYSVILGHLGDDAVAANSIVTVVRSLGTVLCFGLGSAAGIIVGQILGEDKIEEAKKAGNTFLGLSVVTGILGGGIVLLLTPFAMSHARLSETALDYLLFMLRVNIYYITGTSVNTMLIAGVFRAGGDSKFGFWCDVIDMWCYAVPLGFLAAFALKLPVEIVYFLLCTDEFVKWPWVFKRYFSFAWAKNITRENLDADA